MALTPLLDSFKRGEVARDVRLLAAQGELAPRALEQLAILVHLGEDADADIRAAAEATLGRIPSIAIQAVLAEADAPVSLRERFEARGLLPVANPSIDVNAPLIDGTPADETPEEEGSETKESITSRLTSMNFPQRLKAAIKGTREMRAILIRDPNKMIAAAVLSSPKLTDSEVEAFSRMAQLSEETLRTIGSNRSWIKNYSIIVGLTKNPKTPLAMSLNMMPRLKDRELSMLAMDRNVPEPLRIAARKRMLAATSAGQR